MKFVLFLFELLSYTQLESLKLRKNIKLSFNTYNFPLILAKIYEFSRVIKMELHCFDSHGSKWPIIFLFAPGLFIISCLVAWIVFSITLNSEIRYIFLSPPPPNYKNFQFELCLEFKNNAISILSCNYFL